MSANRNWDIAPAKRQAQKPAQKPASRVSIKRIDTSVPLRTRRRRARKRFFTIILVIVALIAGLLVYGLHRPEVRIRTVEASGAHADAMPKIALDALKGSYYFVIPKDSVLFYPEEEVRAAILDAFPDISSLSIGRTGFSSLSVEALTRIQAFSWCGAMMGDALATCYEADGEGFIFRETAPATSTLRIYGQLKDIDAPVIGNEVAAADQVPIALQFVRAIESMGAGVESLQLRGDETDLFIRGSATRITYILGQEREAAQLAASVLPTINLTDGSIEYLDLRFEGKAYVNKRQPTPEEI